MTVMSSFLRASVLALVLAFSAHAAAPPPLPTVEPVIEQSRGADQRVDYPALTKFGPWDDRNYDLTFEDLQLLHPDDQYLYRVPVFFKVLKRKEFIEEGTPLGDLYPREIHFEFYYRYGGLMQNGEINLTSLGKYYYPDYMNPTFPPGTRDATVPMAAPIVGEGPLAIGNNETSVEVNPVNPNLVIAGSNGGGGQNQNYSIDGGATWITGGVLPQTCCDPAMEWSVDGTVAYAATLGQSGGLRATVFRSLNGGMTWQDRRDVSTGSSDKEFIHVDRSPTSPHNDNVYLTWHQGNVMFFARSTDRALTWSTPISFPQYPTGIGSDITTDPAGNIYYFYPSLEQPSARILVLRSTDGGLTWSPPVTVVNLRGRFDFAVPSMESRRVFIYVSADTDRNTGRVWAAFTDKSQASPAGGAGTPNQNVAIVRVAYSDDQGATWTETALPHAAPLPPGNDAIDRYHQWLAVDIAGTVHMGYYDTRHTTNRTGVDFYYVASADGGNTWVEETRVSATSSVNITNGQEWGDYNGLAVNTGQNNLVMTWTDNRIVGASPLQRSFAARVTNLFGEPGFLLGVSGSTEIAVCAGQPLPPVTVTVASLADYVEPTTLSLPGLNVAVFGAGSFSPNPVVPAQPAATSALTLATQPGAAAGDYVLTIQGQAGVVPNQITQTVDLDVSVFQGTPGATTLTTPANNSVGVSTMTTLSWSATTGAQEYLVELATDPAFTNIVFSTVTSATSAMPPVLTDNTNYYWRVTADNPCGVGSTSAVFTFKTSPGPGACDDSTSPVTVYSENFSGGLGAYTTTGSTGASTWAISTARPSPASGGNAVLAVDLATTSDQRLISPPIALPSGQSPVTLRFWNDQTLEDRNATSCWDGGLLDISTDNGVTWTSMPGAAMLTQPYVGPITAGPATGLDAWCGDPIPYVDSIVDVDAYAGQTVRFRWRVSTDGTVGRVPHGWYVDDIRVQACASDGIFANGFELVP